MSTSSLFHIREHIVPGSYIREYPGATLHNQEDELKLHVKQYIPKDNPAVSQPGAVTIIGAHANGFPKELYEPFWESIYATLKGRGARVRGIWIADVAHQGRSGVLNEGLLGNDPSWMDHPRDLAFLINLFREEMPRPIVGVGHSMGGNHLINVALTNPRLFSTLVLVDPVVHEVSSFKGPKSSFAKASTFRRDVWASRAEAAASFKSSKFFQSWDPRVLDLWVTYGLRELPTAVYPDLKATPGSVQAVKTPASTSKNEKPVTLTTTKHQEVFTFQRPNFSGLDADGNLIVDPIRTPDLDVSSGDVYPFYRPEMTKTFSGLPYLRPSVLYIFGGRSPISAPDWRHSKMLRTGVGPGGSGGRAAGRVKEVFFEKAGHLMPMEMVSETATASSSWIAEELEIWRAQEERWEKEWKAKSVADRTMTSEEWEQRILGDGKEKAGKL